MLHLKVEVVLIGIGAKTNLLQDRLLGIGLDFFLLFLLLVLKLGVVYDLAHRRIGIGGIFTKIQTLLLTHLNDNRVRKNVYFIFLPTPRTRGSANLLFTSFGFPHNTPPTQ